MSPTVMLNDGTELPAIGFGTYRLNGAEGVAAMAGAIRAGYRLIDSAASYDNEGALGAAVRAAGAPRAELRLASKLPGRRHRFAEATAMIEESLWRAGLDHWDLYLLHWPNPSRDLYVEAWGALIEARARGLTRSIGVCNFLPEHLERLIAETGVAPAVNQVELHPYFPQDDLRAFHRDRGIATLSWSPIGRAGVLMAEPALQAIAARLGRSVPQTILRWHLQLGAIPLPKAAGPGRQAENLAIFDFALEEADMAAIAALARPDGRSADRHPLRYEDW